MAMCNALWMYMRWDMIELVPLLFYFFSFYLMQFFLSHTIHDIDIELC